MAEEKLTAKKKAELIAGVRKNLSPELQTLFDEYSSGRNPQLTKKLQDANTDWKIVLTNWKNIKDKKEGKQEKKKNRESVNSLLDTIKLAFHTKRYNEIENALSALNNIKDMLEQLQKEATKQEIDTIKERIKRDKARLKVLEGVQDENAED